MVYTAETKVRELKKEDQVNLYLFLAREAGLAIAWLSLEEKFCNNGWHSAFSQWRQGGGTGLARYLGPARFERWLTTLN